MYFGWIKFEIHKFCSSSIKMASFTRNYDQNRAFLWQNSRNHAFSEQNNHYTWPKHELRIEPGTPVHACICINTIISCTFTNILFLQIFWPSKLNIFCNKISCLLYFCGLSPFRMEQRTIFLFRIELFRVYNGPIRVYFRWAL